MICPHCKKENANEYAVVCAYCKGNMYPGADPEEKAKELKQAQQKDSASSSIKSVLSVILAIVVIVGVILMPKPSFNNKNGESTPVQNQTPSTTQNQPVQNIVTTTKAPIVETTTQKQKISYAQAIKILSDFVKKGQYDAEENSYSRAIKQYDTSSNTSNAIMLLLLKYYPETNTLSLVQSYNTEDYSNVTTVRIEGYETTEMVVGLTTKTIITTLFVSGTSTKDTYRPGANIPCTDYTYFGTSGGIEKHTAADEREASNDMTSSVASMLRDFDTFLKSSNAGFDLTTLGYKSFYGI